MNFFIFLLLLFCPLIPTSAQTVYLIRHGEKPSSGDDGLSALGLERAQCLVNVFGANTSSYNIGYIIAEQPKSDGSRARPYETILPLATSLGLTPDTSCTKKDASCVASLVTAYAGNQNGSHYGSQNGSQNILICWEHGELTNIVTALGSSDAPTYSSSSFDIIWTDPSPYSKITNMTSEDCPGLDD